jgi:hypothetical protein
MKNNKIKNPGKKSGNVLTKTERTKKEIKPYKVSFNDHIRERVSY